MQKIEYKVYTENLGNIDKIVSKYFDGFTLVNGYGYWVGVQEYTSVIVIVGTLHDKPKVLTLANDIVKTNSQSSIYVTYNEVQFIEVTN